MSLMSRQAFEQAYQHAQTVEKHGRGFQQVGLQLQEEVLTLEQGYSIEQTGVKIQQHGARMLAIAEKGIKDKQHSLQLYEQLQQEHIEAISLYTKAIQEMVKVIRSTSLQENCS